MTRAGHQLLNPNPCRIFIRMPTTRVDARASSGRIPTSLQGGENPPHLDRKHNPVDGLGLSGLRSIGSDCPINQKSNSQLRAVNTSH